MLGNFYLEPKSQELYIATKTYDKRWQWID